MHVSGFSESNGRRELQRKIKGLNLSKAQNRVSVFQTNTFQNVPAVSLGQRMGEDRLFVRVTVIDAESLCLVNPLKDRTLDAYVKIRLVDQDNQVFIVPESPPPPL